MQVIVAGVCHTPAVRSLLVIRHGETEWNVAGRWQGWLDIPLSEAGHRQARARGSHLAELGVGFVGIVSSDLARAAATADHIATALGDRPPIHLTKGLRERCGGEFEGLDASEIDLRWPGFRERWRARLVDGPPGGESDETVWSRVQAVLETLSTYPEGPLLIVTHGGVVRVMSDRSASPTREVMTNVGGRWFEWNGDRLRAGEFLEPIPDTDRTRPAIE